MRLSSLIFLLLVAFASGCSSYRPAPLAFHEAINESYRLGGGDVIRLTVYEEEELTKSYAVDQAGYLHLPLVGSVPATGRTVHEVEADIAARLRNGFIREPDVAVEIDSYRPIFIMGEVGAGGQYSYVPGLTIQKAIAISGGFSPRAQQANVDVTRVVNGEVLTGRVPISDPLLPGDTIYVRERLF